MKLPLSARLMLLCSVLFIALILIFATAVVRGRRRIAWLKTLDRQMESLPGDLLTRGVKGVAVTVSPVSRDEDYFASLSREIENCCNLLGSMDPQTHRRGEMALYDLGRRLIARHRECGGAEREELSKSMDSLACNLQVVCGGQIFPDSPERTSFARDAGAFIEKGDPQVSIFAARLLGVVGDRSALPALERVRGSDSPRLAREAVISLGLLGSPDVAVELEKMLSDPALSIGDGRRCVAALERIGGGRAEEILREAARSARPLVAYDAYLALRRIAGVSSGELSLEAFVQLREVAPEELLHGNI